MKSRNFAWSCIMEQTISYTCNIAYVIFFSATHVSRAVWFWGTIWSWSYSKYSCKYKYLNTVEPTFMGGRQSSSQLPWNKTAWMHVLCTVQIYQWIYQLWLYNSSSFVAFITFLGFFWAIALARYLCKPHAIRKYLVTNIRRPQAKRNTFWCVVCPFPRAGAYDFSREVSNAISSLYVNRPLVCL